jgi:hypothetical protein
MRSSLIVVAFLLSGCNSPLLQREADTQAVQEQVSHAEPTGVVTGAFGEDAGVVYRPPIPTDDLCYMRSKTVRNALYPIRCEDIINR